MQRLRRAPGMAAACAAAVALTAASPPVAAVVHDGRHDFDFHFGRWKTHISRLTRSARGTRTWETLDGTVAVRAIWHGRANLEEVEADGPAGHFEGLGLFVYDPRARQWNISFARNGDGAIGAPPSVGEFKDGRGEFYDQELQDGKPVIVRLVWSNITPDAHDFEQAVSSDGGRTWEPNFRASLTRKRSPIARGGAPAYRAGDPNGRNAFDFAEGTWNERTARLLHPLTGSKMWIRMKGVSVDRPIWNGRANLVELESDGPNGHLELLSLRLFNPQSKQWNLYFATSPVGVVSDAMTGAFHHGHGEFYGNDTLDGRSILVRFRIDSFSPSSARSEQAFSADGGKTWEVNWINDYTRTASTKV